MDRACRPAPYEGLYGRHESVCLDDVYGGDQLTAVNLASSEQQRTAAGGGGAAASSVPPARPSAAAPGSGGPAGTSSAGAGPPPFLPGSPPPGDLLARLSASGPPKGLSAHGLAALLAGV